MSPEIIHQPIKQWRALFSTKQMKKYVRARVGVALHCRAVHRAFNDRLCGNGDTMHAGGHTGTQQYIQLLKGREKERCYQPGRKDSTRNCSYFTVSVSLKPPSPSHHHNRRQYGPITRSALLHLPIYFP